MTTRRRSRSLCGINILDVFSLFHRRLVRAETLLGILVNALVGGRSTGFDHVQNASFIRCQSDHFASQFAGERCAFAEGLVFLEERGCEQERLRG